MSTEDSFIYGSFEAPDTPVRKHRMGALVKRIVIVRPDGSRYVVIKRVSQNLIPESPSVEAKNLAGDKSFVPELPLGESGSFESVRMTMPEPDFGDDVSADSLHFDQSAASSVTAEKKAEKERIKAEKKRIKAEKDANRIPHPIGAKLIAIISAMVVIALGGVTYLVSYFVSQDVRTSAEENNLAINSRTASDTENRINTTVSPLSRSRPRCPEGQCPSVMSIRRTLPCRSFLHCPQP